MSAAPGASLSTCPACRSQNLEDARFCSQCGIRLENEQIDSAPISTRAFDTAHSTIGATRDRDSEPAAADPLIGVVVAERYRLIEPIGRGGMGVVYRAEHARIGKLMALKLLTGELSRNREVVERFKREALMASKLSHPNTVQVFDFGTSDGLTYLAMEYLDGKDLGRHIRREGRLSPTRTSKIVIQICGSLSEAHDLGMVHRDLKPENILILVGQAGDEVVKVLDFGLAKLRESKELSEVTTRGAILGTPFYMSPEQIQGEPIDQRGDVYSLGALMYMCLTGRPVFDAPNPVGVLTQHITEDPVAPCDAYPELSLPIGLSDVVIRCLQKDPKARFQNVRELQAALVDELRGEGQSSSVDALLDSGQMRRMAQAGAVVATRDEVERYERKLRRRGQAAYAMLAVMALAIGLVGWQVWQRSQDEAPFAGREIEPNDTAATAQPVPFAEPIEGRIGKRLSPQDSDRDFFGIEVPAGTTALHLETTALPNLATCTSLYRVGFEQPLGRYCTGGPARPLSVPRLEVTPGKYLVAVMQDREDYGSGDTLPVYENVSDDYRLKVEPAADEGVHELEPNDTERDANVLKPGEKIRGTLGWMRDVDVYCTAGTASLVVEETTARPPHAVLSVTPIGGPADGIPVRIHADLSDVKPSPRDARSPWGTPEVDSKTAPAKQCVTLELVPNPWAPTPHPRVAPASNDEYIVTSKAP